MNSKKTVQSLSTFEESLRTVSNTIKTPPKLVFRQVVAKILRVWNPDTMSFVISTSPTIMDVLKNPNTDTYEFECRPVFQVITVEDGRLHVRDLPHSTTDWGTFEQYYIP